MKKVLILFACIGFLSMQVFAQRTVTGTVTGADDGMGLPGVSVLVKGTQLGTLTDLNGGYSLAVPEGSNTLVFEFMGMVTQEVAITGDVVNAAMQSSDIAISDVVVTAFGIKRNPREMGVATYKVSEKELTNAGVSNVMNGLAGKVSGLQINTISNGVNPETKITLRGNRHLLASNQALVVLDGVPISATYLNSINPNDIENVNVLKGASAAALYGNDASNGVLVVTTKKGGKDKLTVKVSNTTNFERISYLPNLQERFASGSGESLGNADNNYTMWIGPDRNTDPYTSYENQSYGPEYDGSMRILGGKLEDGSYQMVPFSPVKNQKRNFFQTGVSMQNDVSLSGGDERSDFYVSVQDVKSTGTVPGDKNRRTSARMSAGREYGIFKTNFTLGFTQTNTNVSGGDMNQNRGVYWNVLNTPAHVPLTSYKDIVNNKFAALDGYFNAYYPNPYWQIEHSRALTKRNDLLGSLNFTVNPTNWLQLTNRSGIVYNTINYNGYTDEAVYSDYSKGDPWSQGHMGTLSPYAGNSYDQMTSSMILTNDFLAISDKQFGDIKMKAIAGVSIYSQQDNSIYDAASSLVIPDLYNVSNRVGEATIAQYVLKRNSVGVFGDLTVGYKEFVSLHMSGRNDWDSRLVQDNRSFFYPAVDVAFIVSDMVPALKDNTVLSFLKVRAGWSKTGQVALTNWYATIPEYFAGTGFPYGSVAGFRSSTNLSNPTLKPEITTDMEAGIEMSFLKNRIHLETNIYKGTTNDQTIPAVISASTGYSVATINAGEMENKGVEVDLKFTPIIQVGGLVWNAGINYTYQESKLLSLMPGLDELFIGDVAYAVVGEQFPTLKVTDVQRDPDGRIIVDAKTGLPKKEPALQKAGHGNPNHILGVSTDLSYKGIRLTIVAEYRTGNNIHNAVGNSLDFTGVSEHSTLNGRQPFVIPNSVIETSPGVFVPNTDVVVPDASRAFWVNSDYHTTQMAYVTSAATWKLREVSISYDVPVSKLWGGKVIREANVSLIGRNLLMFRPKTNVWTDPEFNTSGATSNAVGNTNENQTPPTRIFGFSVKLTF